MVKNHNRLGISDNLLNSVEFIMNNSPALKSSEETNNEVNLYEMRIPYEPHDPDHIGPRPIRPNPLRFTKIERSQDYEDGRKDAYHKDDDLRKKHGEPKKNPDSHKIEKGKDGKHHLIRKASPEHVDFHNKAAKEHVNLRATHIKEHNQAKSEVETWTKQEKEAKDHLRKVKRDRPEDSETAEVILKKYTNNKHSAQARKDYHEGKAYTHGILQMQHESSARDYAKDYDTHTTYKPEEVAAAKKRMGINEGWNPFKKKEATVVNQYSLTHGALLRTPFLDNMYPIHHQHIMDIAHNHGFKVTKQPDKNENVADVKNMSDGTVVKDYSSSAYELTYKKDPSHTVEIYNGYVPHGWGHKTDMAFSHKHNGKDVSSGYGIQKHDSKPEEYIKDTFK